MRAHLKTLLAVTMLASAGWAEDASVPDAGGLARGWFVSGKGLEAYRVEAVDVGACVGARAVTLHSVAPAATGMATVMQMFRADDYRGKRVRLSATMWAEGVTGRAALWVRVDGKDKRTLAFDNMKDRPLKGSQPCGRQSVTLDVAPEAEVIALGVLLEGDGAVEMSDLEFAEAGPMTVPNDEALLGRVNDISFSARTITQYGGGATIVLPLVKPGEWRDRTGDSEARVEGDHLTVKLGPLSGDFDVSRLGKVTYFDGTWGGATTKYPVSIRVGADGVDMTWGFYERHLRPVRSPQLAPGCVYFAEGQPPNAPVDSMVVCGAALSPGAETAQALVGFLVSGFRHLRGEFSPTRYPTTAVLKEAPPSWPPPTFNTPDVPPAR